ncbi:MAG: fumarylacetoacetate hydrolase family protein [Thermoanaerobaculia bacterium]
MRLVTYCPTLSEASASGIVSRKPRVGVVLDSGRILDLAKVDSIFSGGTMVDLIREQDDRLPRIRGLLSMAAELPSTAQIDSRRAELIAPIPRPVSLRDGYAFRQHVETARRNRGLAMIPEFDRFPVFYFSNHLSVIGPGILRVGGRRLEQLDFELEAFCVVGRSVMSPTLEQADAAIFGYGVMNDFSARALQTEEMKLNLGPAKGKDFATALGPWLVTKDELVAQGRIFPSPRGNIVHAAMTAQVNGVAVSRGNLADMSWTFAQILARAADGVVLEPGEVIGSGTVGTGCFLELNGSGVTRNQWLRPRDQVSLTIESLGTLTHDIVEDPSR